jgi:hypothetical protein
MNAHANAVRSGKGHTGNVLILNQGLTNSGTRPGHKIEYAIGQSCFAEAFCQQARGPGGIGRRLENEVLPVTRAAPEGPPVKAAGKLKGLITSHTP